MAAAAIHRSPTGIACHEGRPPADAIFPKSFAAIGQWAADAGPDAPAALGSARGAAEESWTATPTSPPPTATMPATRQRTLKLLQTA
jgi:hypothetical protein